MNFCDLIVSETLLESVRRQGYSIPTPIQEQAIPVVLEGRDVLGCAQTGTGKTAAFALPIIQMLGRGQSVKGRRKIRALALAPTRELASQIGESFASFCGGTGLRQTVIFGGVGQNPQTQALRAGVDILVATPGRLLDLMGQGYVDLGHVKYLVLDEADRMLDMGFIPDIKRVVAALPQERQSLLFSATLPPSIRELAGWLLNDPVTVTVTPPATTVESIAQSIYYVGRDEKMGLLIHLLAQNKIKRALVFSRTKYGADKIVRTLNRASIPADAIHGNKSQNNRQRALESFRHGDSYVLVATDIASRGLDIDSVSHVFNFDLPDEPEVYVHRIGRTGRAGSSGMAFSFCDAEEMDTLYSIEKLIRMRLPVEREHPFHDELLVEVNERHHERRDYRPQSQARPDAQRKRRKFSSWSKSGKNGENHRNGGKSGGWKAGRQSRQNG